MKIDYILPKLLPLNCDTKRIEDDIRNANDWKVTQVNKFPSVNGGEPVVFLERPNGAWLELIPLDWLDIVDVINELLPTNKR